MPDQPPSGVNLPPPPLPGAPATGTPAPVGTHTPGAEIPGNWPTPAESNAEYRRALTHLLRAIQDHVDMAQRIVSKIQD